MNSLIENYIKLFILQESVKVPEAFDSWVQFAIENNKNFGIYINQRGELEIKYRAYAHKNIIGIILKDQKEGYLDDFKAGSIIVLEKLTNPDVAYALNAIKDYFPNFKVYVHEEENLEDWDSPWEFIGNASSVISRIKEKTVKHIQYGSKEEKEEEFKYLVIEELKEKTWFHATLARNVSSIKQKGLLPSNSGNEGWSQFNFNLQSAVYLTSDMGRAEKIAYTLGERHGEDAVILKIDSSIIDEDKAIIDEDALRDKEGYIMYNYRADYPSFITSAAHRISSIGYAGIIPSNKITVAKFIDYDEE